jgi:hypothetical protein
MYVVFELEKSVVIESIFKLSWTEYDRIEIDRFRINLAKMSNDFDWFLLEVVLFLLNEYNRELNLEKYVLCVDIGCAEKFISRLFMMESINFGFVLVIRSQ